MNYAFKLCLLLVCFGSFASPSITLATQDVPDEEVEIKESPVEDVPVEESPAADADQISQPSIPPWDEDELPSAETVLNNCILAVGGYEVLGSRGVVHFASRLPVPASRAHTFEFYKSKHNYYCIFRYDDGRIRERGVITDGTLNEDGSRFGFAWEIYNGHVREMHGDELQEYLRRRTKVNRGLIDDHRFRSVECVGRSMVNDREAFELAIVDHDGTEITKFYDTQTWLCLRRVCEEEFGGSRREVTRDYPEYKWNGEQLYAAINHITYSGRTYKHTTTVYETNAEPPPGTFDIPQELASRINTAMEASRQKAQKTLMAVSGEK